MKILRILSVIALVLAVCGNAGAAVTLRTAPFPGPDVLSANAMPSARVSRFWSHNPPGPSGGAPGARVPRGSARLEIVSNHRTDQGDRP